MPKQPLTGVPTGPEVVTVFQMNKDGRLVPVNTVTGHTGDYKTLSDLKLPSSSEFISRYRVRQLGNPHSFTISFDHEATPLTCVQDAVNLRSYQNRTAPLTTCTLKRLTTGASPSMLRRKTEFQIACFLPESASSKASFVERLVRFNSLEVPSVEFLTAACCASLVSFGAQPIPPRYVILASNGWLELTPQGQIFAQFGKNNVNKLDRKDFKLAATAFIPQKQDAVRCEQPSGLDWLRFLAPRLSM